LNEKIQEKELLIGSLKKNLEKLMKTNQSIIEKNLKIQTKNEEL